MGLRRARSESRDRERAAGRVTRLARRPRSERPRDALSPTKLALLAHLHAVGPTTPSEVAEAEHQQLQSLTRVFADLERTALISRAPSEDDRRASVLTITSEGVQGLRDDMVQRDRWLAWIAPRQFGELNMHNQGSTPPLKALMVQIALVGQGQRALRSIPDHADHPRSAMPVAGLPPADSDIRDASRNRHQLCRAITRTAALSSTGADAEAPKALIGKRYAGPTASAGARVTWSTQAHKTLAVAGAMPYLPGATDGG
jgi:DNA-binding MarR family transcriptional regulator